MKERLDQLLFARGLAASRRRAQALILAGAVRVDGRRVDKPGTRVPAGGRIEVIGPDHPFVGRGGVKLAGALDRFDLRVDGAVCLDAGSSTGGFTDCLLQRGAARVVAVDVGRGQLDWKLRNDERVRLLEGVNARHLDRERVPEPLDLVTVDLSFISLRLVLPPLSRLNLRGPIVALVKPQFELGRDQVGRGGIVRDPDLHRQAVRSVARFAAGIGFPAAAAAESPITGADGNREFFLLLRPGAGEGWEGILEEIFDGS